MIYDFIQDLKELLSSIDAGISKINSIYAF